MVPEALERATQFDPSIGSHQPISLYGSATRDRPGAAGRVASRASAPDQERDVSAGTDRPDTTSSAERRFSITLGLYNQTAPWTDVRSLLWPELARLLQSHEVGPKEGSCIVPAIFIGQRRRKDEARRIDLAFLDSDAGATLQEIRAAVEQRGWEAIISSTHSHLSTATRGSRKAWDRFKGKRQGQACSPAHFLITEKNYLPRVAEGAYVREEGDEFVIFAHQPCPKFRVVIPLVRPWLREDFGDCRAADAAWKQSITALAAALRLDHDQACTDTSRLFYLPRRPPDGPQAETAVLEGKPCDIFSLPQVSPGRRKNPHQPDGLAEHEFTDPETGEVFDLAAWAREHGHSFQLVNALRARQPGALLSKVTDATKHHIRCVNEDEHTQAGADAATFIMNASESSNKGFVYHCRHAHCDGRDRLFFLRRMLEEGWLKLGDLRDPRFRTRTANSADRDAVELTEHGVALAFAQRHKDDLRFCHTAGSWYLWTGSYWLKDETRQAFNRARQLVASLNRTAGPKIRVSTGRAAFASGVEQFAKADEVFAVTAKVWDRDPYLLCTPGGVVDLRTGRLRPPERSDYMTRITATAPADTVVCPRWHQFLQEVTGADQELIRFLQQWFGYTLTGDTREEALLFVYGPGGNGKGKLLNTIQGILGTYCRTAPLETFTVCQHGDRHPTDLAMLNGARMVCASETEEGRAWAEVRIKQLTGNDVITARFMRRDFFEYRPHTNRPIR